MELIPEIEKTYKAFSIDADKAVAGNKTAGQRARKNALALVKLLKAFRKESLTW